jgi:hypothetical protein
MLFRMSTVLGTVISALTLQYRFCNPQYCEQHQGMRYEENTKKDGMVLHRRWNPLGTTPNLLGL